MSKLGYLYFRAKKFLLTINRIFFLFYIVYFLSCSRINNVKEIKLNFPEADQDLILLLTSIDKWENDTGKLIRFHKEKTFQYFQESEPGISGTGKFQLKDKQIKLVFSKEGNHISLNGEKYVCNFVLKPHSWKPQQYISCVEEKKKYKFELANPSSISYGNEDNIDNIKITVLGYKPTTTKRSVYLRELPTTSGKIIPFSSLGSEECLDEYYLFRSTTKPEKINPDIYVRFPKKFDLTLVAKTQEKYNIDQYNNHWYYVKIFVPCIGYVTTKYGWVYGEFID
ncbi:hypothetical protein LEP1GSC084_0044 [Leptospira interrogans serovar Medanensis str. L0448]|uniref:hypothetical protein n=1 Tax=Leptospira TaxID=171 RepID=UPI0002BDBA27|nr:MULTISPECIES: hypothetical protein [Leptospira]EMN36470.1 hypothetical protein LEP1GSC084_0044 [Leptospira interrogans serovar Medanensis str. L0448]KGE27726.1 hypothetical protein IQ65_05010 [Leptospira interrogans serovar Lai]UML82838.1 hypothetical protein FH587_02850 [Leptospira interrogans]UNE65275.1 hypothetical protein FH588_02340 [Leptospira interrogans]